ncbi:uncharacterized protein BP5553_07337 [Venustampulla echinocandica]|uniref:Uncharacterized protein n=1 Tax=Venustampulla echinocandica TaxID=2656787 RepID=A0A370TJ81_9HELO|nr:uncharacterized protein BP5553_07337 [Venustampulla echinocandica]RDL35406.1 hypothetical protein BP5553_07337 [Venustampulla echinocandica]
MSIWGLHLPDEFRKAVKEASDTLTKAELLEIYEMKAAFNLPHGLLASFDIDNPFGQLTLRTSPLSPPENTSGCSMARNKSKKGKGKSKDDESAKAGAAVQTDNLNAPTEAATAEAATTEAATTDVATTEAATTEAATTEAATTEAAAEASDTKAVKKFYVIPHSGQRLSRADYKGYLDYDGNTDRGVNEYWKLDVVEETWPTFTEVVTYKGLQLDATRIPHAFPRSVRCFYTKLKGIIVAWCKEGGFRGGAFAEKINFDSPLYDILHVIHHSPVVTKEQRQVFEHVIMKIYDEVNSDLLDPQTNKSCNKQYFKKFDGELEWIGAFFQINSKYTPPPMPNDISDVWLEELGPKFTANYRLALAGDPAAPFKVATPRRNKFGMSMSGYELGPKFRHSLKKPVKDRVLRAYSVSDNINNDQTVSAAEGRTSKGNAKNKDNEKSGLLAPAVPKDSIQ